MPKRIGFLHQGAESDFPVGPRPDGQVELGGVGFRYRNHQLPQLTLRIAVLGIYAGRDSLRVLLVPVLDDRRHEITAAGKVVIEAAFRDAKRSGDIYYPHMMRPLGCQDR